MASGGGGGGEEDGVSGWPQERGREGEELPGHVLALPTASLPAVVCHEEAAVPRKARSRVPRAAPAAWCSYRVPALPPQPPAAAAAEGARFPAPRPLRVLVAPFPDAGGTTFPVGTPPAKRARRCLYCDSVETPQWRQGPRGRGTLCNACGIVYRATGALPEHPPGGEPPESPIWSPSPTPSPSPSPAIYLVRKSARERAIPAPAPAPAPPPPVRRAKKKKKKMRGSLRLGSPKFAPTTMTQWREFPRPPREEFAPPPPPPLPPASATAEPRKTTTKGRSCVHCGSTKTPQWREGPMGRGTLCNACGVRYRQGRLLPEYRPIASPTFVPSEHANSHRQVLKLHQLQKTKNPHPPPPPPPPPPPQLRQCKKLRPPPPPSQPPHQLRQCKNLRPPSPAPAPTVHSHDDPPVADERPTTDAPSSAGAPECGDEPSPLCSLDSLLLDGPSAPPIVDGDGFFTL